MQTCTRLRIESAVPVAFNGGRNSESKGEPLAAMYRAATLAIHADSPDHGGAEAPATAGRFSHDRDVAAPIGVTTTFESAAGGHVYSRDSAPTRERCEAVLAAIEAEPGGPVPDALLYSSGLAAIHAALVALLPSIKRVAISGGYHGTHQVLDILRELRPELMVIELPELELDGSCPGLESTDLVWLEVCL